MAIKRCKCEHKGQDKLNGKNMRVCNPVRNKNQNEPNKYRCTVCAEVQT